MPTEVAFVWGVKLIGGGLVTYLVGLQGWITRQNHLRLQNTLSRTETAELIDLKINPLQSELNLKIDQLIAATQAGTSQRTETNDKLQQISTDMAVMKNEVVHLKENIDRR